MKKNVIFGSLFFLLAGILPSSTHAAVFNEEQQCHELEFTRFSYCHTYQWSTTIFKTKKTKHMSSSGEVIRKIESTTVPRGEKNPDGTAGMIVTVYPAKNRSVKQFFSTQTGHRAKLQKYTSKIGTRYFEGKRIWVRNRYYDDTGNGDMVRKKTIFVRDGNRVYKIMGYHWGKYNTAHWDDVRNMMSSFELQ